MGTASSHALFALVISVLAIAWSPEASASRTVDLESVSDFVPLAPHLEVLVDPQGNLSLDDVAASDAASRWRPCGETVPTFGLTSDTFWFRFRLTNPSRSTDRFLVEIPYPGLDRVELFSPGEHQVAGDTVPHTAWPLHHRFPLFPVMVSPGGSKTFHLRVRPTGATQVNARLWRQP